METKCYCGHTTRCDCGPEEMKQTAIEWLVSEANLLDNNGWILPLIEKAKEMEKQQIIDATIYGNRQEFYDGTEMIGDEYYNETFSNDRL